MVFAPATRCRKVPVVAGRGTTATVALERAKIPFTVHEYAHDPRSESYGREASEALGVTPDRVFKTLVAEVDPVVIAAAARALQVEAARWARLRVGEELSYEWPGK